MESKKIASTILSVSCRILVFVLVAMTLVFLAREAYAFGKSIFVEQPMATGSKVVEVVVEVPEDYTKKGVAEDFFNRGLVSDKTVFYLQILLSDRDKLTPGIYTLNTGMKPSEIIAAISVVVEEETTAEETTAAPAATEDATDASENQTSAAGE